MAQDSRSRNNRKVGTRTRVIDGGTSTQKIKGAYNDSSGEFIAEYGGAFATRKGDGFVTKDGRKAKLGGETSVDSGGFQGTSMGSAYGGPSEGNYLLIENQNPDKKVSEKVITPNDLRLKKSDKSQKGETANRKKEGRSGLRIKLDADPSAGRLKNQSGGKAKKKVDVQGGGGSGLNIPR